HVGMNSDAESFRRLGQQLQEMEAVRIVAVHGLTLITSGGNVVTTAGPLDAQWPCHGRALKPGYDKKSIQICQMLRCDPISFISPFLSFLLSIIVEMFTFYG